MAMYLEDEDGRRWTVKDIMEEIHMNKDDIKVELECDDWLVDTVHKIMDGTYGEPAVNPALTAGNILTCAQDEMKDRSKTYDKPEGERSMAATVKAFSSITGIHMTEQNGWQFMEVLKMVRSNQGRYKLDSFIDGAAYAALAGEAAARSNDDTTS